MSAIRRQRCGLGMQTWYNSSSVPRFSLSRQAIVYGSHGPNHRTTQPMRLVTEQERLIEFVPFRWRSDRISSATERGHEMQTAEQPPRLSFVSPKWRRIKVIIIILKVASRFPVYRLRRWKWSNFIVKLNGIFVGWGNLVIFHGIYSLLLCDSPELSILLSTIDRGNECAGKSQQGPHDRILWLCPSIQSPSI